jgi:hypothetical protein
MHRNRYSIYIFLSPIFLVPQWSYFKWIYKIITSFLSLSATNPGVLWGSTIVAGIPSVLAAYAAARPAFPPDAQTIFLQPCCDAWNKYLDDTE